MKYFFAFIGLVLGFISIISIILWAATGHSFWMPLGPNDDGRALILTMLHFGAAAAGGASIAFLIDEDDNTFVAVDHRRQEKKVTAQIYEWDTNNPVYKKPKPK